MCLDEVDIVRQWGQALANKPDKMFQSSLTH